MKQAAAQLPALQISPGAHVVPPATLLQSVVLPPGWQLWHALLAFAVPDG
jgi:hypothetical protein